MTDRHPVMAKASHDELAEQLFVKDLKVYIGSQCDPIAEELSSEVDPGQQSNSRVETAYNELKKRPGFARYLGAWRASQDLLWSVVGHSIDRQRDELEERATPKTDLGSITLNSNFEAPDYLVARDVHQMPGGYGFDDGGVRQGALIDSGGAVYMLGRNGGFLNDGRGWSAISHLVSRWPDFKPESILEMGCGIGASIIPFAKTFPDAKVQGVDVGASMLRYAHARAQSLGAAVHFKQGDAANAPFEDESFDLVFSCAMLHETSLEAIPNIMKESMRLLKPGGIVIHLEVPDRYDKISLWKKLRSEMEREYNNEPNWRNAISADYDSLLKMSGFDDVSSGFQDAAREAVTGNEGFNSTSKGVFRSWFVASGMKPTAA